MSLILLGILNSQAAGGGGAAYDLLETTTFSTNTSSVTFSGLDSYSDYKHLQIRGVVVSQYNMRLQVNDDTGANYRTHFLKGQSSSVTSGTSASTGFMAMPSTPFGQTTTQGGAFVLDVLDFSSTNKNTTFRMLAGSLDTSETDFVSLESGAWFNTSAVTKLRFFSFAAFPAGRFSLYGVK